MIDAITGTPGATLRNNFGDYVGCKITVGAAPLYVQTLGRFRTTGNSQTHTVKIARIDKVTIASVSINTSGAADNAMQYVSLASPLTLSAATTYYLLSLEFNAGDQWRNVSSYTPSADISIPDGAFVSGGTWYSSGDGANKVYVPVGFQYSLSLSSSRRRRLLTGS
jgi:hypothetical protein